MADITVDGRVKVYLLTAIAVQAAPTTAELNAGTQIDGLLTPDGLQGFEPDTADVDNSALNSTFTTTTSGRAAFSNTALRLKKQSGTDTLYNAWPRDTAGFVVIRRDGTLASVAWGAGQKVEVYPIITGETKNLAPAANEVQKYELPVKITATPTIRATTT